MNETKKDLMSMHSTYRGLKLMYGKWIRLIRAVTASGESVYYSFEVDAKRIAEHENMTLLWQESPKLCFVKFGEAGMLLTRSRFNRNGFRVIIVDCETIAKKVLTMPPR